MTNGQYIEVDLAYKNHGVDSKGRATIDEGVEYAYAVREPEEQWDLYRVDEGPTPDEKKYVHGGSWKVFGGQPVLIYSRQDLQLLRKLLDAIETRLPEEQA